MFLVNNTSAVVLFDSGASYSFISAAYVGKHNLPLALLRCQMIVSSPGGDMPAKQLCPKVNLKIRGVDFVVNLIVLESKGIDVILGIDWLSKHMVLINCAKKSVKLTTPKGKEMEFVAEPVVTTKGVANRAKVNQLDASQWSEVSVVNEFPIVFPEELPGMPPDRDIEFVIELNPGTTPIYKTPYRMTTLELAELKEHNSGVSYGAVNGEGNGRWEGRSEKRWDTMSIVAPIFIRVADDGAMIRFPRKR
jgi:hypothetical protein